MNHIWWPAKLLDRLEGALAIEYGAQAVVLKPFILLVVEDELALEKIFVVKKIHLKAGIGERGHFDLKGKVIIVNRNIDPRKANHFMKPVPPFIYDSKPRHDTTHLESIVI